MFGVPVIEAYGMTEASQQTCAPQLAHHAVMEAVAFAMRQASLGEEVAAAVALDDATPVTDQELRAFVSGRIAEHKVPRQIVKMEQLPKGPTGKLQRTSQAERLREHLDSDVEPRRHIAPGNALEAGLLEIWRDVLNVAVIGITDNFFDTGGNSLQARQIVSRVEQTLGIQLGLAAVLRAETIRKLAKAIEDQTRGHR